MNATIRPLNLIALAALVPSAPGRPRPRNHAKGPAVGTVDARPSARRPSPYADRHTEIGHETAAPCLP